MKSEERMAGHDHIHRPSCGQWAESKVQCCWNSKIGSSDALMACSGFKASYAPLRPAVARS
jgi:hypothetical protein